MIESPYGAISGQPKVIVCIYLLIYLSNELKLQQSKVYL